MIKYMWILLAIIMYSGYAFTTKMNNFHQSTFWFIAMWVVGSLPLWNIISRNSNNLLVDGFIYDLVIISSYVVTMIILGEAKAFCLNQWIGVILCICGIISMKVRLF